jgi:hypothetical protein
MSFEKLLDQLRDRIRARHFSLRTEQSYVQWAKAPLILWTFLIHYLKIVASKRLLI